MKKEYQDFFEAFKQFRKLHMGSLIPELSHTDFAIMMKIRCLVHGYDPICMEHFDEFVAKNGGKRLEVKVSQLSEHMHMNATAVSRSLKSLEERQYIIRTVSTKDRRITYVDITGLGEEVLSRADHTMNDFTEAVFKKMGDDNLIELTNYLNKLFEIANEEIEQRKEK